MYLLRFQLGEGPPVEISPANGEGWDIEPLSHAELATYAGADRSVTLTLRNAIVEGSPSHPGQSYVVRFQVSDLSGEPLFGLVEFGWVPFPFMSGDMALMDRNVISKIEGRLADQEMNRNGPVNPVFDLSFAGRKVSPLPYVLEGRFRKPQTILEMQDSLGAATAALRRVLPEAHIQPVDSDMLRGLHGLLEDMDRFVTKATPFLRQVCPSVADPASKSQQVKVERNVLRLAREHGIQPTSLVTVAVLSCLYDRCEGELPPKMLRPGRAVLKPRKFYSEGDAYAALADLLFIEMLASLQGLGLTGRPVFYTHDLGLAAFWSALRPRGFVRTEQQTVSGTMTLTPELLPALNEQECLELRERLSKA